MGPRRQREKKERAGRSTQAEQAGAAGPSEAELGYERGEGKGRERARDWAANGPRPTPGIGKRKRRWVGSGDGLDRKNGESF